MPESTCSVKSGETIYTSDPRLLNPDCLIEAGVIIRPDPEIKDTGKQSKAKVVKKVEVQKEQPTEVQQPIAAEKPPEPQKQELVEVVGVEEPPPKFEERVAVESPSTLTAAVVGAAGAAVLGGTALAVTNGAGVVGAIQTKVASLFGNKVVAAAAVTGVTAGAIVAVKAMEKKMNTFEKDIKSGKLDIDAAATSLSNIDRLLCELEDDELDPTVECD